MGAHATSRRGSCSSAARRAPACGRASRGAGTVLLLRPTAKLYLDTAFFDELSRRFGAPGDFAAGLRDRARGRPPRAEPDRRRCGRSTSRCSGHDARGRNALSMRLELQADCYAGRLGLFRADARTSSSRATSRKASAQRPRSATTQIQKRTQGYVVPESFTHGTAEQRLRWFKTGLEIRRHAALQHLRVAG